MMASPAFATAMFSPFGPGWMVQVEMGHRDTLLALARKAIAAMEKKLEAPGCMAWFLDHGMVRVNGVAINREWWAHTRAKPGQFVDMLAPPAKGKGGRIALLLATVAVTIGTGFIASGGLAGALGAGFGAGTLGANAAAAGFGLAASIALRALTPPPSLRQGAETGQREFSSAGVSGNAYAPGEYLVSVIGRMRASPPQIIPGYTTLEGDRVYAHMMVAVNGQCSIEDVLINGIPAASVPRLTMETDEGDGATDSLFLSATTYKHEGTALVLSDFELQQQNGVTNILTDQTTPANSESRWHRLERPASAREMKLRLLFEQGIIRTDGTAYCVPVRLRMRKKGDVTWRNLPVLHFRDTRLAGPFRREIRLKWTGTRRAGQYFARNNAWDCFLAHWRTGYLNTFAWDADTYFQNAASTLVDQLPVMTGTTTSGVTVTASAIYSAGFEAWKAGDGNLGTAWISGSLATEQWWKVDFGTAKAIRSVSMDYYSAASLKMPKDFSIDGSNDDSAWTTLYDVSGDPGYRKYVQLDGTAWRYYRVRVRKTLDGANDYAQIGEISLSLHNSYASETVETNINVLDTHLARHVDLQYDGPTIYLDPADWDEDAAWEIEVQRGWAFQYSAFNVDLAGRNVTYAYLSEAQYAHFFTYRTSSGVKIVSDVQSNVASKTVIETVQHMYPQRPVLASVEQNLARIAIRVPDIAIESVSAIFTAHAREWNGTTWDVASIPTRNPASFYRDALLLAARNNEPLPGDVLDENSLETAWDHADTNGFTCDCLVQGRNIQEVLQLLASSMRASPAQADMWGVVIDQDRSAQSETFLLTPMNSRNVGTEVNWDSIPHGLRVRYIDSASDWQEREVMVYRDGYTSGTARLIEAFTDQTSDTEAKASAAGLYHLRAMVYRNRKYIREVGFEGRGIGRGQLGAIADEVVLRDCHYGLVKAVRTSGGNVTGFEIAGVATITGTAPFGVMVRQVNGGVFTAEITETADTSVFTLDTPVANTGQFDTDTVLSVGPLSRVAMRVICHAKETIGEDTWRVTFLPEANEIFA